MTRIAIGKNVLPGPIETTLRRLIWRARAALTLRGVLFTLAAALLGILVSMAVAAKWLIVEPWQHYALTFLWVAAGSAAAVVFLVRPLAKSFSLAGIARAIEQRHPELQERISSTVELLGSDDAPEIRGSQTLIDALAAEAVGDVRTVRPRREVTFRKARTPLCFLTGAAAVLAVLWAIYPAPVGRLFAKTLAPYLNLPNFFADDLLVTPGDCVVVEGGRLEVGVSIDRRDADLKRKVRSAQFRIERAGGGADKVFEMTALADGSFAYTSGAISLNRPPGRSFRYRVRAGDALSRYYTVTVEPRPAAGRIEVGYEYPDYMQRANTTPGPCHGHISGPAGVVATVRLHLNKPVARAELTVNEATAEIRRTDSLTYSFTHRLAAGNGDSAGARGSWRMALTDRHGFRSDPLERDIIVESDSPPTVRILSPEPKKLKLRPTDRLPIIYNLADDFGLDRAELAVSIDGRSGKPVRLSITAAQSRPEISGPVNHTGQTTLNLAALDLTGARQVTFKIRARDNRPKALGGPQESVSGLRTIELDVKVPTYAFQMQLALDIRLRDALEKIYKELKAAKKVSEPLRRSMPATKKLTAETTGKIDLMRGRLLSAEEGARDIAVAAAGAYPKISEKLIKLADNHVGKARELAGLIKITDAQKQRAELADEADFQVDRALAIVSEMLKKLDVLTDLAERAVALEELARRQEELAAAKMPTTMPTTQPGAEGLNELSEQQWQKAQREVAADTAEMVRQTPGAMHEALKKQSQQTANLAEMAKQLQRSQQALAKSAADEQRIAEMKKQLGQLAAEQAKLARQTAQMARQTPKVAPTTQPAGQAKRTTAQAAKALTTTQPASAIPAQDAAAKALDETARRAAAEQLAAAAEAMAAKQEALAKRSEAVRKHQAQAQAARRAAAEQQARQKQIQTDVAKRSADLARRQAALAGQAGKLEKTTKPSSQARPAKAMQASADKLRTGDVDRARPQADQAARQAKKLADELTRRSVAAVRRAKQASAKASQAGAKAAQTGAKSDQAAAKAASKSARQAGDQAKQASGQAQAAGQLATGQARLSKDIAAAAKREASNLAAARQAGKQAAAQQARAAQATRQIQNVAKAQQQLAGQVPQLKELAKQATAQAQAVMSKHDPTGKMQQATGRLRQNRPDQATAPQSAAAEQLRQIAKAAGTGSKPVSPATAGSIAKSARNLAQQQRQLRKRTAALTGQLAQAQARRSQEELTRLRAEQQRIARQAAELSDDVKTQAPQPDRIDTQAARSAAEASKQLGGTGSKPVPPNLSQAAASANKAAGQMSKLAGRLGKGQPAGEGKSGQSGKSGSGQVQAETPQQQALADAERRGKLAGKAGELARRQQQVAKEISALAASRMPQVLAGRQARIAEGTAQVQKGAELIGEHAQELLAKADARKLAQSAAKSLQQAAAAQGKAGKAMGAGRPGQSVSAQQASAKSLGQAARALGQLGRQLAAQARKSPPPGKGQDQAPGQLAEAYDAAQAAAQGLPTPDAARAARLLAALARRAGQQAKAMGMMPGAMAMQGRGMRGGFTLDSNARIGMAGTDLRAGQLIELGLTPDQWARLPGRLKDQVLQASHVGGPEEYRPLIKRYFRALARKAARKDSNRKGQDK